MTRDKPTYSDHEQLASNLRVLFLCCQSVMTSALDSLVRAKRFKLKLEISGQGNPGYAMFVRMARQLGVQFEELELPEQFVEHPPDWMSDHTTKDLRAWVPEMAWRDGDLHVMFPICFEHHVMDLRKHDIAFPMPKVDSLYLLCIWWVCIGSEQAPLSARILRDLLAWESADLLSVHSYAGSSRNEVGIVSSAAMTLPLAAQMYLGFRSGQRGYDQCSSSGLDKHPINAEMVEIMRDWGPTQGVDTPTPTWMVQHYSWEADKVAVILKNAWLHSAHPDWGSAEDKRKTIECLGLRLDGLSEDDITNRLQFDSRTEYDQWLLGRGLDTDSRVYRHPYEGWLTACKYFGVEPKPEVFESLVGTSAGSDQSPGSDTPPGTEGGTADTLEDYDPLPGFRFSQDFRSIHLPNGRLLTLTARQAQVVEMLYWTLINETPEISQGHIIGEVYSGVSENRLKRLFNDNEAYNLLIESGSRRGLVRLRTRFE